MLFFKLLSTQPVYAGVGNNLKRFFEKLKTSDLSKTKAKANQVAETL